MTFHPDALRRTPLQTTIARGAVSQDAKKNVEVEYIRFAVVDRPVCIWGTELAQANIHFLRGFDPEFFLYQARAHHANFAAPDDIEHDRDKIRAALSLRIAYGMAIESLFAVLGALVQAPECMYGWLSCYRNEELRELVSRISAQKQIRSFRPFRPATWEQIAKVILSPLRDEAPDDHLHISGLFAKAWRKFALDLGSEQFSREYNSLKHSFRVNPGSMSLDIAKDGNTLLRFDSKFAHSVPYLKQVPSKRRHYNVGTAISVLEPGFCAAALQVIGLSLNNAVAYARHQAGDSKSPLTLSVPTDLGVFDALWKPVSPLSRLTFSQNVTVAEAEYWSDEDILAAYEEDKDEV